jgi:hypothetical protein
MRRLVPQPSLVLENHAGRGAGQTILRANVMHAAERQSW